MIRNVDAVRVLNDLHDGVRHWMIEQYFKRALPS
jgi:hypothetical protein